MGKRMGRCRVCFLLSAMAVLLALAWPCEGVHGMSREKHVVLLGASVGNAWQIDALPVRLKQAGTPTNYRFEFVGDYQYDKTETLKAILQRKQNKPDAVILKECAAYFPGNSTRYQELMRGWVRNCRNAGVVPVLTTVAPVTRATSLKGIVKDLAKPFFGRANAAARLKALLEFNDWIKAYVEEEGLAVLDLEAALRTSETDRRLREDLHSGDGLHLNPKGYALLDQIVLPALDRAFGKK